MNRARHERAAYRWLWPLLVVGIVCIASANTIEAPFMPPTLIPKDKLAHFAVFGLIATLVYRALLPYKIGRCLNLCSLIAIGITAAFGISDEIHQSFTPARTFDLYDFVADTLGAVVAVCAYRWLPFYRKALEWRLVSRKTPTEQSAAANPSGTRCKTDIA